MKAPFIDISRGINFPSCIARTVAVQSDLREALFFDSKILIRDPESTIICGRSLDRTNFIREKILAPTAVKTGLHLARLQTRRM